MAAEDLKREALQFFGKGAFDQALAKFELAAAAYAAAKDDAGRAEMLNNLGVIRRMRGEATGAEAALTEAEAVFERLGDKDRQAQALGNLGDLHARLRNHTEAARCYSSAAELFAQVGERARQSHVLRALSLLRLRQGHFMVAMMHMEQSLSVKPRLGLFNWLFRVMLRFALRLFGGS